MISGSLAELLQHAQAHKEQTMSKSNANNPSVVLVPVGTQAADISLPGVVCPKKMKIVGVSLLNGAVVAASDSNYLQVSLQKADDTVVAELDTRAAHENGLAAHTKEPLNLVAAQADQAANTVLKVVVDATGTVTLTNAVLAIYWHAK
jgi:hypothetical protein